MHNYFGYIRVSTAKQGEHGVSLQEQREAIARYAQRGGLEIAAWFEERETAAKRGRPVFGQMLKLLKRGQARGVIIHKIDRSARNLKDWADLGELIDQGIEVHFANESLDLHSRGGRLSADIQAVVAADFIRNLRDETRKGFYGRLKQGLYPMRAPVGYLDQGKGKPKTPDPLMAPLVRQAFELYAAGHYSLDGLVVEMQRLGLRNKRGGKVTRNGFSTLLNNPFYIGLMAIKKTGETFEGQHEPLVSKLLFERVQLILQGKTAMRVGRHDFLFRRLLVCRNCGLTLIGERQKGHVYYRCHNRECGVCLREEAAEQAVLGALSPLRLTDEEQGFLARQISQMKAGWTDERENQTKELSLRLAQAAERLNRLTDAFLDQAIEKEVFTARKNALLLERKEMAERLARLQSGEENIPDRLAEFLELAKNAWLGYQTALPEEKRDLLKNVTSNRWVSGKKVVVELSYPFQVIAARHKLTYGDPHRDRPRTLNTILGEITEWFSKKGTAPDKA